MRTRVFFCSSVMNGSRRISPTRSAVPVRSSRIPARTYRVSELISRARAICWRISADGLRRPRSIWLRYGLEMPASSDSLRSDSWPTRRCSRMNSPSSSHRLSSSSRTRGEDTATIASRTKSAASRAPLAGSPQEGLDVGLAGAVAPGELGLEGVDAGEQGRRRSDTSRSSVAEAGRATAARASSPTARRGRQPATVASASRASSSGSTSAGSDAGRAAGRCPGARRWSARIWAAAR